MRRGNNYLTSSADLRHSFGVKLNYYIDGIYRLAFVDVGSAWNKNSNVGVNLTYGLGAQLNTSLINVQFTYGLTTSGSGKFAVRIRPF